MSTHDLRHCYASPLISGGASVKQVQAVLGHSSAAITLRVYCHLRPVTRTAPMPSSTQRSASCGLSADLTIKKQCYR